MLNTFPSPISSLLDARIDGHSLPAGLYTREDVFQADLDVFFSRHWIHVGLECDVPEAGDAVVIDIGSTSLILLRDDDNDIRVVRNVCRHRGARLLDAGSTVISKLVCPYHQWTYELSGELSYAPHMGKNFDKSCRSLKAVNFKSIGGLIYVCLSDNPPEDIKRLEEVMAGRLAPYDIRNAKVAHQLDVIEKGNWKLTMENNRECYHCSANHPELCVSFVDLDFGYDPDSLSPEDREEAEAHFAMYGERTKGWEADGFPSSTVEQVRNCETNFRTQRLIIAGAGESQTENSTAASSKLLGDHDPQGSRRHASLGTQQLVSLHGRPCRDLHRNPALCRYNPHPDEMACSQGCDRGRRLRSCQTCPRMDRDHQSGRRARCSRPGRRSGPRLRTWPLFQVHRSRARRLRDLVH